ncbi:carboxypeptidase Taq [Salipiger thiooxidans]|uniref:Metal-dependent carboxypeptidase n=1 Tax=Salipiger thiooxidans TaxID=282683 RepID=A0A1G7H3X2_9RHOB|nr:carboxypeptidase M32 [Salipiger thiooxidans]SDE95003.1 carboxypeptidase Taq [Salipiger thiooxidans]
MTAYDKLMSFQRETGALAQVAGRLGWDQEVMMPHGASEQRSEEMAVMESILHARRTDPRVGEWLDAVDDGALDEEGTAHLRHIRRSYERGLRVPAKLATDIARITSRAHRIWAEARADDDFAAFAPVLKEVVRLKREEGAALAAGGDAYDALLDDYEPGATAAQLSGMFGALRPRLVALRQAVLDRPQPASLQGTFDEQAQMMLSQTVARTFGYEMARGRIDKAVHPFSSGSGDDVRITTRTNALDPFNCLYSTIHEVGHAAYEQSIRSSYRFTPLGQGVSMGVHESQSRIYENQLGRSRAFTSWLFTRMTELFGDLGLDGPDAFYAAVNRVQNGFIRTEADEVQYNLHVLLRFDLEQALIAGTLEVDDLEAAWNERFLSDFGFPVDKPSDGVLQDVHWSAGLFGYFPTYSLGNVYAGCLHKALRAAVPDLDSQMVAGDLAAATAWLSENVQQYGGLYEPRDVITRACGEAPSEAPLLDYLEAKFGAIYGL